uniref:Self-incompatibility ribonuclease n=1 Tax=Solanum habrochaites TaxID=62890 RepID=D3XL97_SOLHA|nr:self-incompatibility ribonuclease [Solanum habrochaites]
MEPREKTYIRPPTKGNEVNCSNYTMFRPQIIGFFIFLCAFYHVYGTFDQLQLVLRWPTSFCIGKNCKRTPKDFTIHGLWPDNEAGELNFCNPRASYTIVRHGTFEKRNKHWPDLMRSKDNSMDNQEFWKHEYIKHGSCCTDLFNETQYFDLALVLKDRFDLLTTFRTHGIVPRSSHTVDKIKKTIRSVTGVLPNLSCTKNMDLLEIGICFNREASKMIDCTRPKTCNPGEDNLIGFP